jgi:uncharacterized repeat protein (TIGR01451 family)
MNVAGSVCHELIPNDVKDPSEDWTTGTPVIVNLVTNSPIALPGYTLAADQVVRTAAVLVGTGDFTFTHVPPGDYRIIVTNTAVATTPIVPATWTFDTPATGSITPVAVTNADIADQHLGLYQGRILSGAAYHDLATYGTKDFGEDWTGAGEPTVVVNLVNVFGAPVVHASQSVPAGTGAYSFTNVPPGSYQLIVAPAGQTTATIATAPTNWVFVQPETGTLGTFTLTTTDIVDQDFGLTPGRTVSGYVFNDTNPNGTNDSFEDWLTGAPTVVNLVRVSNGTVFATANVNIGDGDFTFTNLPPGSFRIIVTNDPGSTAAGLKLVKAVDKTTAQPGDILTYTITYTNSGASPLSAFFIDDRTPHYTVLAEQIVAEALPASLTGVVITQPANDAAGAIRWDFTGVLDAGASGTVTFKVKVQ